MSNIVIVNGINVIEELEKAQKELEELKCDVKRFMEIANDCVVIDGCIREYIDLRRKLSKVGKEE